MRSCMWITSAVGSSDSAASRATGVAAAALSLSSAPTTAYPVIFFSILTAMTRFLVCLLVCGAWCGAGVGRERALTPTPLPLRRRGALERYFFPATLRVAFLAPAFFAGAFLAALRGAAFFAALRGAALIVAFLAGAFLAVLRCAAFFAGAFFTAFRGAALLARSEERRVGKEWV